MSKASKHYNSPLAVTYAQSLLELGNERNQAVEIGQELQGIGEILAAEPSFREYLADPGISHVERNSALEKIFQGRVSELVFNFLGVLNSHGRLRLLNEFVSAYRDLLDAQSGNVDVDVTSAQPLSAEELEQVRHRINVSLNKNTIIHQYVDESIIGGLVIRVGDKIIDASVKEQLNSMRQQLLAGVRKVQA